MMKQKEIWEIEVGEKVVVDGFTHEVTSTEHVTKPNPNNMIFQYHKNRW